MTGNQQLVQTFQGCALAADIVWLTGHEQKLPPWKEMCLASAAHTIPGRCPLFSHNSVTNRKYHQRGGRAIKKLHLDEGTGTIQRDQHHRLQKQSSLPHKEYEYYSLFVWIRAWRKKERHRLSLIKEKSNPESCYRGREFATDGGSNSQGSCSRSWTTFWRGCGRVPELRFH